MSNRSRAGAASDRPSPATPRHPASSHTHAHHHAAYSGRRDVFTAIGLAFGPVVALGFSRFAYALLLPPMRAELGWTYAQAGGVNTANAIGYIIGAASAAWAAQTLGARQAFIATMFVSALVLLATAMTDSYLGLMVLRFIGGLTTAVTFVLGSSLAAGIRPEATPKRAAFLLAIYFAGVGFGVVLSGVLVPSVLSVGTAGAWRYGWILLGIAALALLLPSWAASRAVSVGHGRAHATLTAAELKSLAPSFIGYALFGAGYVSYMTFVIALLREQGADGLMAALIWLVLGTASLLSTLAWGPLLSKLSGGRGPALVSAIVLLGTLPVLLSHHLTVAFLSAVIFGGAFMAGPTAFTMLAKKLLQPSGWTAGISALTVAFAIGQAIGPVLSGYVSDHTGHISAGLWLSPILLFAAILVTLLQRRESHR